MHSQEFIPGYISDLSPKEEAEILELYQTVFKDPDSVPEAERLSVLAAREQAIGEIALKLIDPVVNIETTVLLTRVHRRDVSRNLVDPSTHFYAFRAIYYAAREYESDTLVPSDYITFVNGLAELPLDERQIIQDTERIGSYTTSEILREDVDPVEILWEQYEENMAVLDEVYMQEREKAELLRDALSAKISERDNWSFVSQLKKDSQRVIIEDGNDQYNLIIALGSLDNYQDQPDTLYNLIEAGIFEPYPSLKNAAMALHDQARLNSYDLNSGSANPELIVEDLISERLLTFKGKEAAGFFLDASHLYNNLEDLRGLSMELEHERFFTYYGRRLGEIFHDKLKLKEVKQRKEKAERIIPTLMTKEAADLVLQPGFAS